MRWLKFSELTGFSRPALLAGGAAARVLQATVAAGFPAPALAWLRSVNFPLVNPGSTIVDLPARTDEHVGSCYAMCCALQSADSSAGDTFMLGRKLSVLMPRLLFGPLGCTREAASRAMRRRCRLFCAGEWQALWQEMPVPPTAGEREARQRERDRLRGFSAQTTLDGAIRAVHDGRLSAS